MKKVLFVLCLLSIAITATYANQNTKIENITKNLQKVVETAMYQLESDKEEAKQAGEKADEQLKILQNQYSKYAKEIAYIASQHKYFEQTCLELKSGQHVQITLENFMGAVKSLTKKDKEVGQRVNAVINHVYYLRSHGNRTLAELERWVETQTGVPVQY